MIRRVAVTILHNRDASPAVGQNNAPTLILSLPATPQSLHFVWWREPIGEKALLSIALDRLRRLFRPQRVLLWTTVERDDWARHLDEGIQREVEVADSLPSALALVPESSAWIVFSDCNCLLLEEVEANGLKSACSFGFAAAWVAGLPGNISPLMVHAEFFRQLVSAGLSDWLRSEAGGIWALQDVVRVVQTAATRPELAPFLRASSLQPATKALPGAAGLSVADRSMLPLNSVAGVAVLRRCSEDGEPTFSRYWELSRSRWNSFPPSARRDSTPPLLLVSVHSAWSGAEAQMVTLAAGLWEAGYPVAALVGHEGLFTDRLREAGAEVLVFGGDFATPLPANIRAVSKTIQSLQPSLIHLNHPAHESVLVSAQFLQVPIVTHARVVPSNALGALFREVDGIIAVSDMVRRAILATGVSESLVQTVYDGIPLPPSTPERSADLHSVWSVGNLGPRKNQHFLLRAVALMHSAHGAVPCESPDRLTIDLFGEVEDSAYAASLSSAAQRLKTPIRFRGFSRDVWRHRHPLAVVMANALEPLGTAALEAMAHGIPVVARAGSGLSEIIVSGENGFLVKDEQELARVLNDLAQDHTCRDHVGARAKRTVEESYSVHAHTKQVLSAYASFGLRVAPLDNRDWSNPANSDRRDLTHSALSRQS